MSTPLPQTQVGGSAGKAVSTPDKWPSKKRYKDTVTLVVGLKKDVYVLHKDVLCFYSDFFYAAFNGSFKEASERKIELLNVEVKVFEAFQVWLYTRSLQNNEEMDYNAKRFKFLSFSVLAKLWIFGDQYQIPLLQNNAIDTIFAKVDQENHVPAQIPKLVYDNTVANSHLRKAVIEILAHRGSVDHGECSVVSPELLKYWTVESIADLACAIKLGWENNLALWTMPERDKCHFHVHAKGEHC